MASVFVAAWGLVAVLAIAAVAGRFSSGIVPLLLLPCAAVAVSHLRVLSRRYVPCRTVAVTELWALPPGMLAWWLAPGRLVISYAIAWVLGLSVIAWRIGKSQQEDPGAQPPAGPQCRARCSPPAQRSRGGGPARRAASGRGGCPATPVG